MNFDISVIIVNWNVKNFLRSCLMSIYRFTEGVTFEVFVVDNNSSDGSQQMLKNEFPQVNFIANAENLGFARANNQSIKLCTGSYILLLNPDTQLIDNSLRSMKKFMDSREDISAIGCKLIFADGTTQYNCRHFPTVFTDLTEAFYLNTLFPKNRIFNYHRMEYWKHDYLRQIDVPYGACLLIRRSVIAGVGLMDERFFLYYDEMDWCYRIKKKGGRIFFVPDIKIIHNSSRSSKQIYFQSSRWMIKSKLLFFEKHYGIFALISLFFNLLIRCFIVWCVFPVIKLFTGKPRHLALINEELKSILGGFRDFLVSKQKNEIYSWPSYKPSFHN